MCVVRVIFPIYNTGCTGFPFGIYPYTPPTLVLTTVVATYLMLDMYLLTGLILKGCVLYFLLSLDRKWMTSTPPKLV